MTPDPTAALVRVALQAGATSVANVDVAAMLSGICVALVPAARVGGAVLSLREPADPRDPEERRVFGSDTAAVHLGTLQRRAGSGPGPDAERDDRVVRTPDLARCAPPALAATATACGLRRSLTVPVPVAGRVAGTLQVFGRGAPAGPLPPELADALRPVVTALAARIADVREMARLADAAERTDRAAEGSGPPRGGAAAPRGDGAAAPQGGDPCPADPTMPLPRRPFGSARIPPLPAPRVPAPRDERPAGPRVPAQRRPRHRRPG
ncbi:hypothetical protein [Pseudonocardia sp. HH130630-07]|uniref:hypothetical protein n=1 Tax=Pseudonocardia sp. HH130630-07 TaxID=1690815 RepID=UPI000814C820|nr:hypothetical protein [Pseudonocardia sp. HH130630-07]ANY08664.1 hypothetical protein AFB00_23055 [Pseudonocardia sp. HH130630-07]